MHLGDAVTEGFVVIQAKDATRAKVVAKVSAARSTGFIDRGSLSKLRGDLVWMGSQVFGQLGAILQNVLRSWENASGSSECMVQVDALSCDLILKVVTTIEPRTLPLAPPALPPVIIYSDASFERGICILGWIVMVPGLRPVGGTCRVPTEVVVNWPGEHHVYKGELLCAVVVPYFHSALLAGRQSVWFVDNEAACSAMIRGRSGTDFGKGISLSFHLLQLKYAWQCWVEWIDSPSNPSDGLSRVGVDDDLASQLGWQVQEYELPHWVAETFPSQDIWNASTL